MSTGKSSIALVWIPFRVESYHVSSMRGREGPQLIRDYTESGFVRKKSVSSSADFPQNSLNEDPVPIAFSDRISSTHVTSRAGRVEGLESRENQTACISNERCP